MNTAQFHLYAPSGNLLEECTLNGALSAASTKMEEDRLRLMAPGERYDVVDDFGVGYTWERIA